MRITVIRGLHQNPELIAGEFAVAQDLGHQSRTDDLARVLRHDSYTTIRVVEEVMTPFHSCTSNPARRRAAMTSLPVSRGERVISQQ